MSNFFFFESERYEPDIPQAVLRSPLGRLLNKYNLPYEVRARDEHMIVTDSSGKEIEIEPWQYVYVREDGTVFAEWE